MYFEFEEEFKQNHISFLAFLYLLPFHKQCFHLKTRPHLKNVYFLQAPTVFSFPETADDHKFDPHEMSSKF